MTVHPELSSDTRSNFTLLQWEVLEKICILDQSQWFAQIVRRAPVPGGWLVQSYREMTSVERSSERRGPKRRGNAIGLGVGQGTGLSFIPDAKHEWTLSDAQSPSVQATLEKDFASAISSPPKDDHVELKSPLEMAI